MTDFDKESLDRDIVRAFLTYGTSTDNPLVRAAGEIYGREYDPNARPRETKSYYIGPIRRKALTPANR